MAAIYWRGDDRAGAWWIKFYPQKGADAVRVSLDTVDNCQAELIQQWVELQVALRRPELSGIDLPQSLLNAFSLSSPEVTTTIANIQTPFPGMPLLVPAESPAIEEVT